MATYYAENGVGGAVKGRGSHGVETNGLPPSSNISIMREGRVFMSYDGTDSAKPLFLYYVNDAKLGSFIAQSADTVQISTDRDANRSNTSDRLRIPLHMITDVFLGRQSPLFTTDVNNDRCFSIISKQATLHLAAEDNHIRNVYMDGIKDVFKQSTSSGVGPSNDKTQSVVVGAAAPAYQSSSTNVHPSHQRRHSANAMPAPAAASAAVPSSAATAATSSTSPSINAMITGNVFTSYFMRPDKSGGSKQPIYLWYDSVEGGKLGALCWSTRDVDVFNIHNNRKFKSTSNILPVRRITDVFLGKQSEALQQPIAKDVPANHCFSIIGKDNSLYLAAMNEAVRSIWLTGIKDVYQFAGYVSPLPTSRHPKRRFSLYAYIR